MPRVDAPFLAGELETFLGFLDYQRLTLLTKCEGLSDEQLRIPLPTSSLTLAGLLLHCALDEDSWFGERFAGGDPREPWASVNWDADPDWEFRTALDRTGDDLRATYAAACERSRAVTVGAAPDAVAARPMRSGDRFTLRWVVGHMIEETARHNGHADLLREAVDGATGE